MSSKIKILSDNLINQIAAGEVIERPASVVKELVENAIDAQATQIEIELQDAGKKKISVRDNGTGMAPEDAVLCIERHATSKINALEDLFKVKTLGFRGEALPSISSVSKLTLTTRSAESHEALRLKFSGGKKMSQDSYGAPQGTEIIVEDLFFNTPARLKFLKSKGTETSHCVETISQLSMIHPSISFRLVHEGREVLFYSKTNSSLERLLAVLKEKAETFLPVENESHPWLLQGFVGLPRYTTSSAQSCYTFINGRPVRDRTLLHAISAAYQNLMPHRQYPKVVLFLETSGEDVDVNVHPTKREVRFKETHFIHSFVEKSIKHVLNSIGHSRESGNPEEWIPRSSRGMTNQTMPAHPARRLFTADDEPASTDEVSSAEETKDTHFSFFPPDYRVHQHQGHLHESQPEFEKSYFRKLNYIGQLKSSYLICEHNDELIFIDQHAAHERVAFERLKKQYREQGIKSQYLLIPISLELTAQEASIVTELTAELQKFGFEIEPFGGTTFVVKAVPQELFKQATADLIRSILVELKDMPRALAVEEWMNKAISTFACHSARTAKEKLERQEVQALFASLDLTDSAPHCPHGRPFSFSVPISEIEKKFHR